MTDTIAARYFDGRSARLHMASLGVGDGMLRIATHAFARDVPLDAVHLAEPFAAATAILRLPDGARCEIPAGPPRQALLDAIGYQKSRVERWQERWPAALAALAAIIALLALFYFAGVPYLADRIAISLPPSVETSLGETALSALESRGMLQPSRLSDERIAEVRALLPYAMPAHPRRAARLLVRDSTFGANAITLPDGTIIVTDALVRLMVNEKGDLDGNGKARLLGVLGHEIGHLEQRHITRALAGSSLVAALSASLFGDFSAVAAGVPAVLTKMEFSRDMELAADDYAIGVLHGLRISPLVLADALADLKRGHPDGDALPRWMRTAVNYLSTHPDTDERIARIQAVAR